MIDVAEDRGQSDQGGEDLIREAGRIQDEAIQVHKCCGSIEKHDPAAYDNVEFGDLTIRY